MAKIIISYRRSDTDAIAGRIRDRLAGHFGEDSIFMDIDDIPFGTDFRDHIKQALLHCDIVLVVVGVKWIGQGKGKRTRINEETDPVRIEVETALQHAIPVVPVLVNGARMPTPAELPESLADFAFRNAATVDTGRDFHAHVDRLIRALEGIIAARAPKPAAPQPQAMPAPSPSPAPAVPPPAKRPHRAVALAIAGLAMCGVLAALAFALSGLLQRTTPPQPPTTPTACSNSPASSFDEKKAPAAGPELRDAIKAGITPFFLCGSVPAEAFARVFATLSVVIAEYAPAARCFNGDAGATLTDWSRHKSWADTQRRADLLLVNLRGKIDLAHACIAAADQPNFYGDMARAFAAASASGSEWTLTNPTLKGERIDRCLNYARDCDEPAALAICQRLGFGKVTKWNWAYVPATVTLGDRMACTATCGAFTTVSCAR